MQKDFDLVVIGTGTTAKTVAYECRSAGWSVAVVDSRPYGGTCAQRGCDPKKVLVAAAEAMDWIQRMKGRGVVTSNAHINWQELMEFKKTFTESVPAQNEKAFTEAGIECFHGTASFTGEKRVQVGEDELHGKHLLIATGSTPAQFGIPGEEYLTVSDDFLELKELPKEIAFMGGGYISMEFAHIAARAGAQVKILHGGHRPLEGFDADMVAIIAEASREAGIDIRLNTRVTGIEKVEKRLHVHATTDGDTATLEVDMIVHGAGRMPNLEELNLEAAGVERERRGVSVNQFLQSVSNPRVYAGGDCSAGGGLPLTPVAGREGLVIAHNLLHGNTRTYNVRALATAVFTIPPMASVGLAEAEAEQKGIEYTVNTQGTAVWYTSRRIGEKHSGFKVLLEKGSRKVLGAHMVGHNAEEVINVFALAIQAGFTADDMSEALYAYPTLSSNIGYMVA